VVGIVTVGWVVEVLAVVALVGPGITEAKTIIRPEVGGRFPVACSIPQLNSR
jgi:hypothetical protein